MRTIFETCDGTKFDNSEQALKYEALKRDIVEIPRVEKRKCIPLSELKNVFEIGDVCSLMFLIKDEDGDIEEDGNYETNGIDETGHLECTDFEHGLLEWNNKEQAYFRTVYGHSWKVEILGISKVSYY
jgi:hypothetical protein